MTAREPLRIDPARRRYRTLIGTGGIGSGTFFALTGNQTLGREESRSGRFLDRADYCKLHIVAHYVQILMGPGFVTLPIGKVGEDDTGRRLLVEMADAGLGLRYVRAVPGEQTLNAICLVYPDGSGGNLTVADSASAQVDPALVGEAEPDFTAAAGQGVALAVPEVPLAARRALLELGTRHGFFRAASFTSEEIRVARDSGLLTHVDLLALNADEAAVLAELDAEQPPSIVVEAVVEALRQDSQSVWLSVTAGNQGSWVWDGQTLTHAPAHEVEVVSTAGAGDAHLAGILAGLAAGLPLSEAHQLGCLTAAKSVTCRHTIDKSIDRLSLKDLAVRLCTPLCRGVRELLG